MAGAANHAATVGAQLYHQGLDDLSAAANQFQEQVLTPIQDGIEHAGDVIANALGFGGWTSVTPSPQYEFDPELQGSTLTVTWTGAGPANLTVDIVNGQLLVVGPTFVAQNIEVATRYDTLAQKRYYKYANVTFLDQKSYSLAGIDEIVLNGSSSGDDSLVVTPNVPIDASISGGAGNDFLEGGGGNNTLSAGNGNDTLEGGSGDNWFYVGDGSDILTGGSGSNTMFAGNGNDLLTVQDAGSQSQNYLSAGNGNDTLVGSPGNDTMWCGTGSDFLQGGSGTSHITAGPSGVPSSGADTVDAGSGQATVTAGVGDDYLEADNATAVIDGGTGNDTLVGGTAHCTLYGGVGAETLLGGSGDVTMYAGAGADYMKGGSGSGSSVMYGGNDGNLNDPGSGNDVIIGGAGRTTIYGGLSGPDRPVDSNEAGKYYSILEAQDGPTTIFGGNGPDLIIGGSGTDSLQAGSASDTILGGSGPETIQGGSGDDTLVGAAGGLSQIHAGSGNDLIGGQGGNNTIYGGPGTDTLEESAGANFTLTDASITFGSVGSDTIAGSYPIHAVLTTDANVRTFDVSGWSGMATLIGGGGIDTVQSTNNANFTLTNSTLTRSDGAAFTLQQVSQANLTGISGNHSFDVSGWTGTGTLTESGGIGTIISTGNDNFTLADSQFQRSDGGNLLLSGIANAVLSGGPGNNAFDVSGWTGTATLVGGGGNDTIVSTDDANFVLTDSSLTRTNGGTFALSGIDQAQLTGGTSSYSDDSFDVTRWTYGGTLNGGGGADTLISSNDESFWLSDTSFSRSDGADLALSGIHYADLTGGPSNDTFNISGWNGSGTLTSGGGADVLVDTEDQDFTLANAEISGSNDLATHLFGFTQADLTGGPSNNSFDVSGWTGTATIAGGGGTDTIVSSNDANFVLADSSLTRSTGGAFSLEQIQKAILTGGPSNNTFDVSGWTGYATLTGGGGNDTLFSYAHGDQTLSDSSLTCSTGGTFTLSAIDGAELTVGPNGNTLNASGFSGSASLYGGPGNDSLVGGAGSNTIYGGSGNDTLYGGSGNSTIYGMGGNDTIYGGTSSSGGGAANSTSLIYGDARGSRWEATRGSTGARATTRSTADRAAASMSFMQTAPVAATI